MSRLVTTGWETGSVDEVGATFGSNVTVVSTSPTPRSGTYCLRCQATTNGSSAKSFNLGSPKTEVWVRLALFCTPASGIGAFLVAFDSASSEQMRLSVNATTGAIELRSPSGTLRATSSSTLSFNDWQLLQVHYQLLSTTSAVVEVWLNGTKIIDFSGDAVATSNVNVQTLQIGLLAGGGTWTHAIDDLAINDTSGTVNNGRPEDGRVLLLKPTGAGSSTQLSRGGTDSGANWSQVDETPPNGDTDYVYSANIGNRDLYTAEDVPGSASAIAVVEALAYARNSDGGAGSIGLTVKSGATISESSAKPLVSTYQFITERWETDPNTGSAWTPSAVNAAEVGVTVR